MNPWWILLSGLAVVLFCIVVLRLHAFLALLLSAVVVGLLTSPDLLYQFSLDQGKPEPEALKFSQQPVSTRLVSAFGNTCGKIGILIALASIIGTSLLKSGGAERIVRSSLQLFGKERVPAAFLSGSFILAIPVFFDTVFYLMIPLVKSFAIRNLGKYSLYLMCIIAGGVMAHSLVPPTPGPLFVAEELGVDMGVMIWMGIAVGVITVLAGYVYARWASEKWILPLRDTPEMPLRAMTEMSDKSGKELPSLILSLLPVILSLVLISGNTILDMSESENYGILVKVFGLLGDSNMALLLSAGLALWLMYRYMPEREAFPKNVQSALSSAGDIILITATGGALGALIQQSGIGASVEKLAGEHQLAVLPLAFFATALMRTAQGSATVAMITAIGILGGLSNSETLGFHPVYLAMAIGCGSKVFGWMNDSGFWIVTKMSGMTEGEGIRFFSYLLLVMGLAGLVAVMVLAKVMPLV